MRVPLVLVPLLAAALGGCVAPPDLDPAAAAGIPSAPAPFAYLLCEGDRLLPLAEEDRVGCNAKATHDSGPAAEVSLAVNPLDPLNLVGGSKDFSLGEDARCGRHNVWSGVYWTKDGGRTWTHDLLPGHPGDDRRTALSAYACGSDPVIAFGPDGTVYYASIHYTENPGEGGPPHPSLGPLWDSAPANASLAVTRSFDGGVTWDDPVLLQTREDGSILDKEWIAVDPVSGDVYVSAFDTGTGELLLQRSSDRGATWTEPKVVVAPEDWPGGPWMLQFAQVAVGEAGRVHLAYWGLHDAGEVTAVFHVMSDDRGETFTDPNPIGSFVMYLDLQFTHKYRIVGLPALVADAASGAVHVAYPAPAEPRAATPDAPPDLDVYLAASEDGGATWRAPVRVNDDPGAGTNGQWMPAIAIGPDGTLHATWLDYRDDPAGQWGHVYYAYSTDGGRTFSTNVRLSAAPFDGTGGYHQSGAGTIGDYMGLAVSPAAVHAFWADTREGRNDVWSAIIPS